MTGDADLLTGDPRWYDFSLGTSRLNISSLSWDLFFDNMTHQISNIMMNAKHAGTFIGFIFLTLKFVPMYKRINEENGHI